MKNILKLKKMSYVALADAIASQFFLGYLIEGFRITLSVVVFPVFLYIYDELNPIKTSIFTGIVGILIRSIIMSITEHTLMEGFFESYQLISFYLTYGVIYYILFSRCKNKTIPKWFLAIIFSDYISNVIEVLVRIVFVSPIEFQEVLLPLFIIAIFRSSIALLIVLFINYYRLLIVKKEHEERYRRLMNLSMDIKSEIYFMNMNINYIEEIMKNAYDLYEDIPDKHNKDTALKIAKDVHEIKKNYIRVIDGIEGIMADKTVYSYIKLKDIVNILRDNLSLYIRDKNLDIDLNFNIEKNIKVNKHYYLMSILRNLLTNSIESIGLNKGIVKLIYIQEEEHIFKIIDNGKGIKDKDINYIFNPGFSTKFSNETGNIQRGIGLTLVKDIVENIFKGTIKIDLKEDETIFIIKIPIGELEDK